MMEFRRITTSGRTILEIDGLRFLAIAAVLLYHVGDIVDKYLRHTEPLPFAERLIWLLVGKGFLGVQLFFMISGFVLALPFARFYLGIGGARPPSLTYYYLRRLTRLEPPYVLTLLLFFALLVHHRAYGFRELLPHLGASLLYIHGLVYGESSWVNRSAWSLEVEVQFYLLAPLAARVFALRGALCRRVLIGAVLVFSLISAVLFPSPISDRLPGLLEHAPFFAAGFLLAELYLRGAIAGTSDAAVEELRAATQTRASRAFPGWVLLPSLVGLCCLTWHWVLMLLLPWYFLLIGVAAFRSARFSRFLSGGPIPIVGGMVYTIYLLHAQIISAVAQLVASHGAGSRDFGRDCLLVGALSLPLVALASAAFYLVVERPCMNLQWPRQLSDRLWRVGGSAQPPARL